MNMFKFALVLCSIAAFFLTCPAQGTEAEQQAKQIASYNKVYLAAKASPKLDKLVAKEFKFLKFVAPGDKKMYIAIDLPMIFGDAEFLIQVPKQQDAYIYMGVDALEEVGVSGITDIKQRVFAPIQIPYSAEMKIKVRAVRYDPTHTRTTKVYEFKMSKATLVKVAEDGSGGLKMIGKG